MSTRLHTARSRLGASLALLLAVALAGCGGSSGNGVTSKSPTEILAASKAGAVSATSVRVSSKNSQGPLLRTSNLELASNGGRAQVSAFGLAFELIRAGNTLYLRGTRAFYQRLGGSAAHVPQGAWLKAPANGSVQLAQLAAFTDLSGELNRLLSTSGPTAKGATTTVNGQKAIELKETAKLFSRSLYVATTGKPYPIQLVNRGREAGLIRFSGWNEPVSLTAPPNAIAFR